MSAVFNTMRKNEVRWELAHVNSQLLFLLRTHAANGPQPRKASYSYIEEGIMRLRKERDLLMNYLGDLSAKATI